MNARELLKAKGREVFSVRPTDTIEALLKVLKRRNMGAAVVRAKFGEVLGVISERDVTRAMVEKGESVLSKEVHELMTYKTISCRPDDNVKTVAEQMYRHDIRHLPVVDNGNLEGMLSIRDVLGHRLEEVELETAILKEFTTVSQCARALR